MATQYKTLKDKFCDAYTKGSPQNVMPLQEKKVEMTHSKGLRKSAFNFLFLAPFFSITSGNIDV
ncbi:hypothetical protein ACTXT7_009379 [Hymenolepis weldensis]